MILRNQNQNNNLYKLSNNQTTTFLSNAYKRNNPNFSFLLVFRKKMAYNTFQRVTTNVFNRTNISVWVHNRRLETLPRSQIIFCLLHKLKS